MGTLKTELVSKERLDQLFDEIAYFVTTHGPVHLIRGMSAVEAHEAIIACLRAQAGRELAMIAKCEELGKALRYVVDAAHPHDKIRDVARAALGEE